MALQFEAKKIAMKQDRTGFILTLCIHPDELPEELIRDFVGARYACAMVRIQDDESPTEYNNRTQKAAILCKRIAFQIYMGAEDEDSAANALCEKLGIQSRAELNGNKRAQALFDELTKEFEDSNDPF